MIDEKLTKKFFNTGSLKQDENNKQGIIGWCHQSYKTETIVESMRATTSSVAATTEDEEE